MLAVAGTSFRLSCTSRIVRHAGKTEVDSPHRAERELRGAFFRREERRSLRPDFGFLSGEQGLSKGLRL
jgi:hypothetical protein